MLNFFIIPVIIDYLVNGYFEKQDRLKYAIRKAVIWNLAMAIFGVFFLGYLIYSGRLKFTEIYLFVISAANSYGTILIVFSMGYGIVKVPKLLLATRSYRIKKAWCMYSVNQQEEAKLDKTIELEKYVCIINAWKEQLKSDDSKMVQYRNLKSIENMIENELFVTLSKRGKISKRWKEEKLFKKGPTESNLVNLNKIVLKKYAEYRMAKFNSQREMLMAIYYREVNTAIVNEQGTVNSIFDPYFERIWLFKYFKRLEIKYFKWFEPIFGLVLAVLSIVFSTLLFFGEVTIFQEHRFVGWIIDIVSNTNKGLTYLMTFTIVLLSYMALICYFGVFYMKIFGFYGFWKKQTMGVTLLNSALYASKMTFPLTFNFMLIFFKQYQQKTDFVLVRISILKNQHFFQNLIFQDFNPKIGHW